MMKPSLACLMLLLATTGAHARTNDAAATPQKTPSPITIAHRKLLEYSGPDSFQYAAPSDFRYGGLKEAIRDSVVGIPTTLPSTNIPNDRFASERSSYGGSASGGGGLRHLLNLLSHGTRVWRDTPQRDTVKLTYHIQGGAVPRVDNRMLVQQSKGPDSWVYAEPSDYQYGNAAQFVKDVIRSEVVAPQQQQLSSARFEQPPPALRGDKRRLMASDDAAAMAADADEHAPASIKAGAGSRRRLLDGHSGPDSWQYGTPDNYRYGGLNNFVKEVVRADVVGSAAAIPDSRFARQPAVVSDK